jgi:hypothetical protein
LLQEKIGKIQKEVCCWLWGHHINFGSTNPYKKDDAQELKFKEDLLFVAKTYMHISIMENQWPRCLVIHQNPKVVFLNQK